MLLKKSLTMPSVGVALLLFAGSFFLASPPSSALDGAAAYTESTVLASDSFSRSVTSGLGTADRGGDYVTSDAAVTSVSNGVAHVNGLQRGRAVESTLPGTTAGDVQIQTLLSIPSVTSARMGLYDTLIVRRQGDGSDYRLKAIIGAGGQVNLVASRNNAGRPEVRLKEVVSKTKVRSGQTLVVQGRVVGSKPVSIVLRAYLLNSPAPMWELSTTDSSTSAIGVKGTVGYGSYLSRTGRPGTFLHDNFWVQSLLPPAPRPSTPAPTSTTTVAPTSTVAPPPSTQPSTPAPPSPPASNNTVLGLDASGKKIPDTNYPIPSGAIFMSPAGSDSNSGSSASPVQSLNKAIAITPAGGTIVARGGVYRDWYHEGDAYKLATKNFTLQAYPHEQVWFDGTDVVPANEWTSDGQGHWYKEWSTPSFCNGKYYNYPYGAQPNNGPCAHSDVSNKNTSNPAAADPQMAFVDGAQLKEVTTLGAVIPGTFFYSQDIAHKTGRIYIGINPAGRFVELAKRPTALNMWSSGPAYAIKGIGFRRYATIEQDGFGAAVTFYAPNTLVVDSVFTEMAARALHVYPKNAVVRHTVFASNGFTAMGSNGSSTTNGYDGLTIDSVLAVNNNTEDFGGGGSTPTCTLSCAYGGIKLAHLVGFTVKNSVFDNNKGNGFWCDNDCRQAVIVNNIARNNTRAGILYEVSNDGIIASNLVHDNGRFGIIVAAGEMRIYNNTVVNNRGGSLWVYDDDRNVNNLMGMPSVGPDTTNVYIKNNILAGDNDNNLRLSPGSLTQGASNTTPSTFLKGLDYNSYYRPGGSGKTLVNWREQNGSQALYKSLAALTAARGWESHGKDLTGGSEPFFVDVKRHNYTLRAGSSALNAGSALPADVAKALGVTPVAGLHQGAINWPGK